MNTVDRITLPRDIQYCHDMVIQVRDSDSSWLLASHVFIMFELCCCKNTRTFTLYICIYRWKSASLRSIIVIVYRSINESYLFG